MDYISSDDLKSALGITDTFADAQISSAITAASRQVDDICNRSFGPGGGSETKTYTPWSPEYVLIDDAISVAAVTSLGGSLTAEVDYTLDRPSNHPDWPYTTVRSLYPISLGPYSYWGDRGPYPQGYPGIFYRGYVHSVTVTGVFGWAAIPDVVITATTILASRLFKRVREATFGVAGFGMDGTAVRIPGDDPDVIRLLHSVAKSRVID